MALFLFFLFPTHRGQGQVCRAAVPYSASFGCAEDDLKL
jgi:hypothetical protein